MSARRDAVNRAAAPRREIGYLGGVHELLKRVVNARVAEVLPEPTPLDRAPGLAAHCGREVMLKREDLTPIFSFKLRGAYNRIAHLDAAQCAAGVIAASAGNHAQGVAFAATRLGLRCRVVMPRTTPAIKVAAVRRFGVEVELVGDDYAAAAAHAATVAAATGMTVVPPFDDLDVIAGQGTVGLEILRQAPRQLGSIFVPIGGGGLAAGIAAVVKAVRPDVRVIGVEPDDSDAMTRSLAAGARVSLEHVGSFADGVAVRQVGALTFDLCRRHLDGTILVSTDEICAAIEDVFEETRTVLEPAGALALAGLKRAHDDGTAAPGTAVVIASGANMNFTRLGYVAERAEIGEQREAILAVTIPERPGSFLDFCRTLGERSVTEFNYRLATRAAARVFVGIEVSGRPEALAIAERLRARGYACVDLGENDLAKTHVRHMVGGRSPLAHDEVLFSFEFPERPGALVQFLTGLGSRWNVSLFHYRNNGAAYGRVLCGFEVPATERAALAAALAELGFRCADETDNPAARLFLLR
ncbi:MAG: threonine ammonia-lyase, biosynthetic [Polyangiaceae bacterium UTPRO1]|jgi:threonine dehydratase|nr:threonine ammonia-lyase, biosynthetic [Myxococcales bacterium]OQY64915.1 MAG: threonine ammonia-lyase, biosynthetic [Polyangiaceae bacterium UTPRO1]